MAVFHNITALNVFRKPDCIELVVKDNGMGMETDVVDKLFRIEEHITNCGTANEPGSGLGLILCKEFLERIGGKIDVDSQSARGTKFTVTLPDL